MTRFEAMFTAGELRAPGFVLRSENYGPTEAVLLRNAQLLGGELGDLFRVVSARTGNLDDLARNDLADRIIAINQA